MTGKREGGCRGPTGSHALAYVLVKAFPSHFGVLVPFTWLPLDFSPRHGHPHARRLSPMHIDCPPCMLTVPQPCAPCLSCPSPASAVQSLSPHTGAVLNVGDSASGDWKLVDECLMFFLWTVLGGILCLS